MIRDDFIIIVSYRFIVSCYKWEFINWQEAMDGLKCGVNVSRDSSAVMGSMGLVYAVVFYGFI